MNKWLVITGPDGDEYVIECKAFQVMGRDVHPSNLSVTLEGGRFLELRETP